MIPQYKYRYDSYDANDVMQYLGAMVHRAVEAKYGANTDDTIMRRVNEEWVMMEETGAFLDVAALHELSEWLREHRYPYRIRGCGGSSLILYLLGITSGNPLPPHRYCPRCKTVTWAPRYKNGFDIPQTQYCSRDGVCLVTDGHDIPWQTLFGYDGHKPTFDIDLPHELFDAIKREWETHWLRDKTLFREVCYKSLDKGYVNVIKLSNISVCFLLGDTADDFYAYEYGARERRYMLNEAGALFEHREWRYPEPNSIADLIALYGIDHATGAWNAEVRQMLAEDYAPSDLIAFRDDVYRILRKHGIAEEEAWRAMEQVRRGRGLPELSLTDLPERDERILDQCCCIDYLFPKAHAVEYILYALKAKDYW